MANRIAQATVGIDVDKSDLLKQINEALKSGQALANGAQINIDTNVDTSELKKQLQEAEKEVKRIQNKINSVDLSSLKSGVEKAYKTMDKNPDSDKFLRDFVKSFKEYIALGGKVKDLNEDIVEAYKLSDFDKEFVPIKKIKLLSDELQVAKDKVESLNSAIKSTGTGGFDSTSTQIKELQEQLDDLGKKYKELQEKMSKVKGSDVDLASNEQFTKLASNLAEVQKEIVDIKEEMKQFASNDNWADGAIKELIESYKRVNDEVQTVISSIQELRKLQSTPIAPKPEEKLTSDPVKSGISSDDSSTAQKAKQEIDKLIEQYNRSKSHFKDESLLYDIMVGKDGGVKTKTEFISEINAMLKEAQQKISDVYNSGGELTEEEIINNYYGEAMKRLRAARSFGVVDLNDITAPYGNDQTYLKQMFDTFEDISHWSKQFGEMGDESWSFIGNLIEQQERLNALQKNGGQDYLNILEKTKVLSKEIQDVKNNNSNAGTIDKHTLDISDEEVVSKAQALEVESQKIGEIITSLRALDTEENKYYLESFGYIKHKIQALEELQDKINDDIIAYNSFKKVQRYDQVDVFSSATDKTLNKSANAPKELERYWDELEDSILDGSINGQEAIERFNQKAKELGKTFDEVQKKWINISTPHQTEVLSDSGEEEIVFLGVLGEDSKVAANNIEELVDILRVFYSAVSDINNIHALGENGIFANLKTGFASETFSSSQFGSNLITDEDYFEMKKGIEDKINTFIHNHPVNIAAFSPQDILAGYKDGLDSLGVFGYNEVSFFDMSKLRENLDKAEIDIDSFIKKFKNKLHDLREANPNITGTESNEFQTLVKQSLVDTLKSYEYYGVHHDEIYKTMPFESFIDSIVQGNLRLSQSAQESINIMQKEKQEIDSSFKSNQTPLSSDTTIAIDKEKEALKEVEVQAEKTEQAVKKYKIAAKESIPRLQSANESNLSTDDDLKKDKGTTVQVIDAEVQEFEKLRGKVKEVETAIEEKTNAVTAEKIAMEIAAKSEADSLQNVINKVDELKNGLEGLPEVKVPVIKVETQAPDNVNESEEQILANTDEWKKAVLSASSYRDVLGDIVDIYQKTRKDKKTGKQLISYRVVNQDGDSLTVGENGGLVGSSIKTEDTLTKYKQRQKELLALEKERESQLKRVNAEASKDKNKASNDSYALSRKWLKEIYSYEEKIARAKETNSQKELEKVPYYQAQISGLRELLDTEQEYRKDNLLNTSRKDNNFNNKELEFVNEYKRNRDAYNDSLQATVDLLHEEALALNATYDAEQAKQKQKADDKALEASIKDYAQALKEIQALDNSNTKANEKNANIVLQEQIKSLRSISKLRQEIYSRESQGKDTSVTKEQLKNEQDYLLSLRDEMKLHYANTEAGRDYLEILKNVGKEESLNVKKAFNDKQFKETAKAQKAANDAAIKSQKDADKALKESKAQQLKDAKELLNLYKTYSVKSATATNDDNRDLYKHLADKAKTGSKDIIDDLKTQNALLAEEEQAYNKLKIAVEETIQAKQEEVRNNQVSKVNTIQNRANESLRNFDIDFKANPNFANVEEQLNKLKASVSSITDQEGLKRFNNELNQLGDSLRGVSDLSASKISNKIQKWLDDNTNASHELRAELERLQQELSVTFVTKARGNEILKFLHDTDVATRKAGKSGDSFFEGWKKRIKNLALYLTSFASFYDIINKVREGVNVVRELDTALTEMRKVSDESVESLKAFQKASFDIAETIGTTAMQIQNSTSDFLRLGYTLEEASKLAEHANIYANVGDMEIDEATEHMISSIKAWSSEFSSEVEASEAIINRYNEIGNNFAISSADIGVAMERSAAALKAGGNTLNESLGLLVSGNLIQQDAETTAAALKILALRIRGSKTELEEMGESTDGLVTSTSKLREEIKALTGVDIMLDENTYKSTAQIIKELGAIYNQLTDIQQATLLEKISGKNRASTVEGLLQNYQLIDEVIESAEQAGDSAFVENAKYLESIEARFCLYVQKCA